MNTFRITCTCTWYNVQVRILEKLPLMWFVWCGEVWGSVGTAHSTEIFFSQREQILSDSIILL